ncbi:lysine-2,3-aminomutase-like protein [Xanthobacteraceae bacterium Astr-EGSB]|uniref:lysine-2,3-aminomutase-like protein n=1 Tax=Astrobacterium formosum TaxID=3069710 RepID=UPI0027B4BCFE|nr:lysine-2,3-aminomutase-like protein [Xanthobacteraceae bacterium Astr-EGSB]
MTPDDPTDAAGRRTLRNAGDLVDAGLVAPGQAAAIDAVAARYAVAIPPAFAALIDPGDANDPIARQFVPDPAELETSPQERADPIGDDTHSPVTGIVHRYPDRVLLKLVHVCPVYCRFCFRRAMVGPAGRPMLTPDELASAYAYIRSRPEIWEVILTGGDPMILSPRRLGDVMAALGAIDHVRVVRVHTRVPVAVPEAITADLIAALKAAGKAVYVVLHANHPRELTAAARSACARLVDAGLPMLSQSVLLKGVNDDAGVLAALMRAFVEARVKPYYLHQGDLAPGTSHLRTTIAEGQALMRQLRGRLSGIAQPTYVLDIPGGAGKVPVGPDYLDATAGEAAAWDVEDIVGRRHRYPPDGC